MATKREKKEYLDTPFQRKFRKAFYGRFESVKKAEEKTGWAPGEKVTPTYIDYYLNGEDVPKIDQLLMLAKELGVTVMYLADDEATDAQTLGGEHTLGTGPEGRIIKNSRQLGVERAAALMDVMVTLGADESWSRLLAKRKATPIELTDAQVCVLKQGSPIRVVAPELGADVVVVLADQREGTESVLQETLDELRERAAVSALGRRAAVSWATENPYE